MSRKTTRLEDIARLAGVSIATASRALNDSPAVNDRTKQTIWKLAKEHDYPFRRYMPAGPIGAQGTIALVVPRPQGREGRLSDPFFLELLAGVGEAARERGCDLLMSHISPANYDELSAALNTSRADGVIFLGQSSLHSAFNRLVDADHRFVVWGAELPDQDYCSIGSDNISGGRRATLHLARLGRQRIVFLGDLDPPEAMQRHRGYLDALTQSGLEAEVERIVPAHFEVESAEAAVDALIRRGVAFDGVVAASDQIALGAVRALLHAGVDVPGQVSVIGFDNVPFSRYSRPALSTIAQDTMKAGRLMVSKLLDHGGDAGAGRSERVPTELIVRETCGG
ncbi:LacI family DNA-binding transcriptional regulator [Brevundimonas sp. SORGH_AS_0993]|uniref:LacI family DNA-binding transcriptional regulator n=1 Tax=Brevundimonas sp. SORGH_AS_0993 TaxID=3041794 RepID=UPI002785B1FC|nr:LacI family DNA-binding transcriptional regulator [Brevundimonas sp. SORGH_AS_0993]MDQ1155438.1 DNA-binding LacI/PurR family transcriptional regulator [Brevundimonas sp. SORGH_AS_0993]